MIVDGSSMVLSLKPGTSKDFDEYVDNVIVPFVNSKIRKDNRVDVVFDRYLPGSIKTATRTKRGDGHRYHVTSKTPIQRNWISFLRNSKNKTQLFNFLAENIISRIALEEGKQMYCTHKDTVLTQPNNLDVSALSPCTHEEADTLIILHLKDAVNKGCSNIAIRATDTDIIIIATALFEDIGVQKLWINFGTQKRLRIIPIHHIFERLGSQRCKGLIFFHALTGADSTAGFVGFSKISAWNIWESNPEIFNEIFAKLSHVTSDVLSEDNIIKIEHFVSLMYKKSKVIQEAESINDTLTEKIKRCVYQSALWRQSLIKDPYMPVSTHWGWTINDNDGNIMINWSKLPDVVKGCWSTFVKCSCKTQCAGNCSCFSRQISCTTLCSC